MQNGTSTPNISLTEIRTNELETLAQESDCYRSQYRSDFDCESFTRSNYELTRQLRIFDVEKIVMKQGNSLHLIQYLFLHKKTMELGNEFARHTKKI